MVGLFEYLPNQFPTKQQLQETQTLKPYQIIIKQLQELQKQKEHYYILSAGTSAGKSSFFVNELLKNNSKPIIVTQPKVALCKEKMIDLPLHLPNLKAGINIGYSVGDNQELKPKDYKSITFMTTEKLQNKLLSAIQKQKQLDNQYILIDEVHDISEQMIVTLLVIKQYIDKFPTCGQFIFMSATIDIPLFLKYFNIKLSSYNLGYISRSSNQQYKKEIKYISNGSLEERFIESLHQMYKTADPNQKLKDVIIFCSDMMQIKFLQQIFLKNPPKFKFVQFSYSSSDDQQENENKQLFLQELPGTIKFIFSTSFLQAGATIQGLKYVIDTGIQFSPCIFPLNNQIQKLRIPISDSNKEQRIGRIGRLGDGIAYLLYSDKFNFQQSDNNPFIINNQQQYNLLIKTIKLQIPENANYVSILFNPPYLNYQYYQLLYPLSTDYLNKGIYILRNMNIINSENRLTPFDLIQIISILCGAQLMDICIITAIFRNRGFKQQQQEQLMNVFYKKDFSQLDNLNQFALSNLWDDICDYQIEFSDKLLFDKGQTFNYEQFMKIIRQCEL